MGDVCDDDDDADDGRSPSVNSQASFQSAIVVAEGDNDALPAVPAVDAVHVLSSA